MTRAPFRLKVNYYSFKLKLRGNETRHVELECFPRGFLYILYQTYDYKLQMCAIVLLPENFEILLIRASGESASHQIANLQRPFTLHQIK